MEAGTLAALEAGGEAGALWTGAGSAEATAVTAARGAASIARPAGNALKAAAPATQRGATALKVAGAADTALAVGAFGAPLLMMQSAGGALPAGTEMQPEVAAPSALPGMDSETMLRARKLAVIKQQQKGGRSSTMLSNQDSLGGG